MPDVFGRMDPQALREDRKKAPGVGADESVIRVGERRPVVCGVRKRRLLLRREKARELGGIEASPGNRRRALSALRMRAGEERTVGSCVRGREEGE